MFVVLQMCHIYAALIRKLLERKKERGHSILIVFPDIHEEG